MTLNLKKISAPALLLAASTLGAMENASAAVDISGVTAAGGEIATVGAAVFLIYIAIKAFHWVRRAL